MNVLIVKTSSMGDVIHTLPAISDAVRAIPSIQFDWVVEEAFAEVPAWHPAVRRVIPVAIRRWRKHLWQCLSSGEWSRCRAALRQEHYDLVIDAQGLVKSAFLTLQVPAPVAGFSRDTVREPLAALTYRHRYAVPTAQHAVERTRELFARALGYTKPDTAPDYGIDRQRFGTPATPPYVLFLHGTTRADKHWPDPYWHSLCKLVCETGLAVKLPWWSDAEHRRARHIAEAHPNAEVLSRTHLAGMAAVLAGATAVVAVDTGLGHLAAALGVPSLSLYGPTSPAKVGAYGPHQYHLQAKDFTLGGLPRVEPAVFAPLAPAIVFSQLQTVLADTP